MGRFGTLTRAAAAAPGGWRGRRVAVASSLALVLAFTSLVYYAVQADGYSSHQVELHNAGIWVTNGKGGFFGRVNKRIGQLDDVLFEEANSSLDVLQAGSTIIGVNYSSGTIAPINPATMAQMEGQGASIASGTVLALEGGTIAALSPDGKLWVHRLPGQGIPVLSSLDHQSEPMTTVGGGAALTVTRGGTVLTASAEDDTLTRIEADGAATTEPVVTELPVDAGAVAITAVGEQAVVLDPERGTLVLADEDLADVPPGSVLQQAGPATGEVLVATSDALLSVSLSDGTVTRLGEGVSGRPARPVRVGDCAYGAWSGGGGPGYVMTVCEGEEPVIASLDTATYDLVFRVNRGEVLLNDRRTGAVWNIDARRPARLDNWDAFRNKVTESDENSDQQLQQQGDRSPPKARPDSFGARPGRTTVLHPLDNDSAPKGRILAIRSVKPLGGSRASMKISPNGQTVQVTLPPGSSGTRFEYYIDDGRQGISDHATVTVTARADTQNQPPTLRKGFEPREWTVPVGGELEVPVLPHWRDYADGDPLAVVRAVALGGRKSGARARITESGRILFHAPAEPGKYLVEYAVTDGRSAPVTQKLEFQVQAATDRDRVPAVAKPDVVSGQVGEPITVRPLGNDLPGSDPLTPNAELELAGQVTAPEGVRVRTNVAEGTLTVRSDRARTYYLDYTVAYGKAPLAHGTIRVDVEAPEQSPRAPVAMPDTITLHGQAPAVVDVLANDVDPSGGLLKVQRAEPMTPNQVEVAVVDGRWLRIQARQSSVVPSPMVVSYTVTNGHVSARGEVVVSQRPPPEDDTPVTEKDAVTVRAGGTIRVPVLDNDHSPSGGPLHLVQDIVGSPAGQLPVRRPSDQPVPTGHAFVEQKFVRYVAPRGLQDARTFSVQYQAANSAGVTSPGTLEVTVIPRDRPNNPPTPPVLEARIVAGDAVRLELPGVGTDPDGDAVTITGIASAPELGRVLQVGANSIEYQAFPGSRGTDVFTYRVADGFGGTATGKVRILVAPPGIPQPPMAVDDQVTVEPGHEITVDILANDVVASGDRVTVTLVDAPRGARLESDVGPLHVTAPARADGRTKEVVYRISNGIASATGVVTIRARKGYNNPPVVFDAFGNTEQGDFVSADVLASAYDPDGDHEELEVTDVYAPRGVRTSVDDGTITIERGRRPMVVPFRVEDAEGGAASAVFYVPPAGGGLPYVKDGARIALDPGGERSLSLGDLVTNPSGGPVSFTLKDRIWAAPAAGVSATVTGTDTFRVAASEDYQGPAAVSFEVTTATGPDDPESVTAVLSIPVQVGETRPVLTCPDEPIVVYQGQSVRLDVGSICHVWTADPGAAAGLEFTADWTSSVDGVVIVDPRGSVIEVAAEGGARAGAEAVLLVRAGDSEPATIPIRVRSAPPPSLAPIRIADMRAGQQRTIDLRRYLRPGIPDATPTLLEVTPLTNLAVTARKTGRTQLTITTDQGVSGTAVFDVVMSDVADPAGPSRRVTGRLEVEILARPDTPPAPVPGRTVRSHEVHLEWRAPDANGAPIDYYQVRSSAGEVTRCPTTSCTITGLVNGREYTFRVRAHNAVGWSGWSPVSRPATPDAKPGIVGPIHMVRRGNHTITIRWTKPTKKTSPIQSYWVSWKGGGFKKVTRPQATITGLDNNTKYRFTVRAENELTIGPPRESAPFQSIGPPEAPAAPRVTDVDPAGDTTAVSVDWAPVNPNGPGPVRYTVLRNGTPVPGCRTITATSCVNEGISYDGTEYTYSVVAINDNGRGKRTQGEGTAWSAVGRPAEWGGWSLTAVGHSDARLEFTVPDSRGAESLVRVRVDGRTVVSRPMRGHQTLTRSLGGNDRRHRVLLKVCNESGACSTSGRRSVRTYGPLTGRHIDFVRFERRNPSLNTYKSRAVFTLDGNGRTAQVTFRSCGGGGRGRATVGPGRETVRTSWTTLGPSQRDCIRVTLSDDNPQRGSVTEGPVRSRPTRDRKRIVEIQKGTDCSSGSCPPTPNCSNSSCGMVQLTLKGFKRNQVTCKLYDNRGSGGPWYTSQVFTNRTSEPGAYYGYRGGTIWASCGGYRSNEFQWPNR